MLRKIFKIAVIVLLLGFAALQFVRPDFTNPPVVEAESLLASATVPPDVHQVLVRSCYDCHSHETKYPWYSKVSPLNWFLADHIADGRRELNFSHWNTYTEAKKAKKLDEICEVVRAAEMPLPSYLWIHRDATLASEDSEGICRWTSDETGRLSR